MYGPKWSCAEQYSKISFRTHSPQNLWCRVFLFAALLGGEINGPVSLLAGAESTAAASWPQPTQRAVKNSTSLWSQVVLIGASATAGFTANEPLGGPTTAQYRLSRYIDAAIAFPHGAISNLASTFFFMQPEVDARRQIDRALEIKPTLVLGADFLFWFCYGDGRTDRERLQRFETGLGLCESFQCPLVVGDIPDASGALNTMLSQDEIPANTAIAAANKRLKRWAASHANVVVLPLSNFMATVVANRALSIHGMSLPEGKTSILLQPDKLHPSPPGCAVLTLLMLDSLASSRRILNEVRWDPKEVFRLAYTSNQTVESKSPGSDAPVQSK
jgi:hypothetical protein